MLQSFCVLAALVHGIDPFYNSTIDCSSFSRPGGYSSADTCLPEGDWTPIFDRPLPEYYADMKVGNRRTVYAPHIIPYSLSLC